ncbi:four helix bundle protein [uncultured Lamprocystis sp.]|uniref:four helix bundle protein n=1 Tax=uncultured Lamprocystis sp. TaxID=543132 RepID=UPI0025CE242A|nr:four helix bundle protein [uncultured Lamprocystis sp.]
MSQLAPVVESCHELLLWLIPQLDGFPRNRLFTLGERLESTLIQVLELLVQAAYSRDKRTPLALANSRLAVIRHLWRLAALDGLDHSSGRGPCQFRNFLTGLTRFTRLKTKNIL